MTIRTPLTADERLARMEQNILRFRHLPRYRPVPENVKRGKVNICGFGPSLADTWREIKGHVMTTSGAHDFLIGKGVIPRYHVEMDSRERKAEFVRHSHPDVTYYINSICHPTMFELLLERCRKVVMWHSYTDDDMERQIQLVERLDPGLPLLGGGSNVGVRSFIVARGLGYRAFEGHGLDCSYRGDTQWAGEHYSKKHFMVRMEVDGKVFNTSAPMMQSTDDFLQYTVHELKGCSFRIHGDGLLEARVKMFLRDPQRALSWGWWKPVSFELNEISVGDALPGSVPKLRHAA